MKNTLLLLSSLFFLSTYGQDEKYKEIIGQLLIVDNDDSKYRIQIQDLGEKYGLFSKEVDAIWLLMNKTDSINQVIVKSILDKYGWLGISEIGNQCSSTLYRVIQHSNLNIQEKYLPLVREAVKNKEAKPSDLATLEDRVALRQGKKQVYGTQVGQDKKSLKYYISPLEDPDNVDNRRAEVGLEPLSKALENYFEIWHLKWDVEQYKKGLPAIMEIYQPTK